MSLLVESDVDVWIGLTRSDSDGFHWVNGDRMTYVLLRSETGYLTCVCRYAVWASGEPSFSHLRKCVAIDSRSGYWKTVDCLGQLKRLCKKALGKLWQRFVHIL